MSHEHPPKINKVLSTYVLSTEMYYENNKSHNKYNVSNVVTS